MKSISVPGNKVSTPFLVPERWELVKYLGSGTYASVAAFRDGSQEVAVKKVERVFDQPVLALRTLREIRLLAHLRHPNVLSIQKLFVHGAEGQEDAYLCLEMMDNDLGRLIHNGRERLTDYQTQCVLYQIMRGLLCLRVACVIHRDLKPSNILIKAEGDVKIADLGLSRSIDSNDDGRDESVLTEYVVTRYYRAPEVVLTSSRYTFAVDIWSVGCILGEMLTSNPLFKGKDSLDQIKKILSVIGTPSIDDLSWIPKSTPARVFVERCCQSASNGDAFQKFLRWPGANPLATELLSMMLNFDPSKRITVDQTLMHRYLECFEARKDPEVAAARAIRPVDWSFDKDLCFDANGEPKEFDVSAFREAFSQTCRLVSSSSSTALPSPAARTQSSRGLAEDLGSPMSFYSAESSPQQSPERRRHRPSRGGVSDATHASAVPNAAIDCPGSRRDVHTG